MSDELGGPVLTQQWVEPERGRCGQGSKIGVAYRASKNSSALSSAASDSETPENSDAARVTRPEPR